MAQIFYRLDVVNKVLNKWLTGRAIWQVSFEGTGRVIVAFRAENTEPSDYLRESTAYLSFEEPWSITRAKDNDLGTILVKAIRSRDSEINNVLSLYEMRNSSIASARIEKDGSLCLVTSDHSRLKISREGEESEEVTNWRLHLSKEEPDNPNNCEYLCPTEVALFDNSRKELLEGG